MSTRSNVVFMEDGKVIGIIYRQYDGYPLGMGKDLLDILCPRENKPKIVNGYSVGDKIPQVFNGMGCLAAYVIGSLKGDDIGNVYLLPCDHTPGNHSEEYAYYLEEKDGEVHLILVDLCEDDKILFSGPIVTFNPNLLENDYKDVEV